MKQTIFVALLTLAITSCGDSGNSSGSGSDTTSTTINSQSSDTNITGAGTAPIPGATTDSIGSAGSPTSTPVDTMVKPR
ncbi:MAG: hypothetical protein ABIN67_10435 [Ferruginibacter sp.]